jgi:hypothetical protein
MEKEGYLLVRQKECTFNVAEFKSNTKSYGVVKYLASGRSFNVERSREEQFPWPQIRIGLGNGSILVASRWQNGVVSVS